MLFLILVCVLLNNVIMAEEAPSLIRFSPQGTVKSIRQVRAEFSSPMVPFGSTAAGPKPFAITCPEPGKGRWVDPHNWVYDFSRDLPGGIRCTFKPVAGLHDLEGKEIVNTQSYVFSTGGPAVIKSTPFDGSTSIAEDQIFILSLDAPATEAMILAHVGFVIDGIRQRLDVQIVKDEQREAILKTRPWLLKDTEPDRLLLLQCKQRFPEKAKVNLVWGKGVTAMNGGVATATDQILRFKVREAFFASFHCERENRRSGCIPVLPFRLEFNANLAPEFTGDVVLKGTDGSSRKAPLDPKERSVRFEGPFPEKTDFWLELPEGMTDDAGRGLSNAGRFPLKVHTGAYPSLAKFAARFGIIERNADPALPLTLRNIETDVQTKMIDVQSATTGIDARLTGKQLNLSPDRVDAVQFWLRKVAAASREKSVFDGAEATVEFAVPKIRSSKEFEVVGIPLKKPGLYIVEIESAILGKALLDAPKPMFVPAAALVTNLSVHFKQGRDSSLVWVTTLDRSDPVKNADIHVMDCKGAVLWTGKTDDSGIARIEEHFPDALSFPECRYDRADFDGPYQGPLRNLDSGLFITARTADDMSFVHSSWNEGIEVWRFNLQDADSPGPLIAHTILDRSLLRAGDTLHLKHVVRRQTTGGFAVPADRLLPDTAFIRHGGTDQTYSMPLTWDKTAGVAESTWEIPQEAKLGGYSIHLCNRAYAQYIGQIEGPAGDGAASPPYTAEPNENWLTSGWFRVEEFRVPLMKGTIQTPAEPLVNSRDAAVDMSVQFLAGGGAGLLPVKLRAAVNDKTITTFEGFEDVIFGNGGVQEGLFRQGEPMDSEDDEPDSRAGQPKTLPSQDLTLDTNGFARTHIPDIPVSDRPREMTLEMEFTDPNGEIQTLSKRVPLWNAARLVGIQLSNWGMSSENIQFRTAVVDLSGKPVADAPVTVTLYQRNVLSHRKRLVGGFYSYDHTTEVKRIGQFFKGKTDASGMLICEGKSPVSGEVLLVAESYDPAGNRTVANQSIWIAGKDEWWFESGDNDRMDLIPTQKRFEPGETASFQVRMPFREATALISVEREGVMETRVQRISGKAPLIEVPIRGNYAPNVYVSVLAVRGRIADIQPTAMADLGKPAYRFGMSEIHVGWKSHELKVSVNTDRKSYTVRDSASVSVRVTNSDGQPPPAGTEIALAAVDEGLLELMKNNSWNILSGMMGLRACSVETSTAQMQVVGKRHFGLKSLPPGGAGGRQTTRELFDTLLLWKGRVTLNDRGEAEITVPLNDSITAFRITAVATGNAGLFGTGSTTIQTTQDLAIFPGLPPLIREGDAYRAGITVRNTSSRPLSVTLSAKTNGTAVQPEFQEISLASGESQDMAWDFTAPSAQKTITWEFDARSSDGKAADHIRRVQPVLPAVPVRVLQATLLRLDGDQSLPVQKPQDALPGGGIHVDVKARLADSLTAVAEYMRQYPYGCLEQKTSIAVALRDKALWDRTLAGISAYLDADGLAKYFPTCTYGDPVLTAYLIAVSHEAGWELPEDFIQQAAAGLRKFIEGKIIRHGVLPSADLTLRKLSAIEALSRIDQADPRLLDSIAVNPEIWPTSGIIDWVNILTRLDLGSGQPEKLAAAEQALRARLSYQGTVLSFSSADRDRLWQLMVSGDVNAVRLLLTALHLKDWEADIPKMVRGVLARQKSGRWDITPANAWGVLAMEKFSQKFEGETVSGQTTVSLPSQEHRFDWTAHPKGDAATLSWPDGQMTLKAVHKGQGKPWLSIQSQAAVPLKEPLSNGYMIKKTCTAVERKHPDRWTRGDILRIELDIQAQTDMAWVAVSDPIPAGATILGSGLERDSRMLTHGESSRKGNVRPAFVERSQSAYRAYFEDASKGTWTVAYTLRLNQSGAFHLPPTRVEALYAPEMFGETPNAVLEIQRN
jgi:uncharacterized protein YfaS (alpha-2-macroglobulin family)